MKQKIKIHYDKHALSYKVTFRRHIHKHVVNKKQWKQIYVTDHRYAKR